MALKKKIQNCIAQVFGKRVCPFYTLYVEDKCGYSTSYSVIAFFLNIYFEYANLIMLPNS